MIALSETGGVPGLRKITGKQSGRSERKEGRLLDPDFSTPIFIIQESGEFSPSVSEIGFHPEASGRQPEVSLGTFLLKERCKQSL